MLIKSHICDYTTIVTNFSVINLTMTHINVVSTMEKYSLEITYSRNIYQISIAVEFVSVHNNSLCMKTDSKQCIQCPMFYLDDGKIHITVESLIMGIYIIV